LVVTGIRKFGIDPEGRQKMKYALALCLLLALTGASVHADTVAYADPGNQGTQGFGGNLGLNFSVVSPITVTSLGAFNASGTGIITGTIQVVIFNTTTNTEVTPVVTFGPNASYTALGFDVFQAITPVVLGPGSYQVDAVGFSASDHNGNLNTGSSSGPVLSGGGSILFTGASWNASATLDDPLTCSGCKPTPTQFSQFDAGTFTFTTPTPTPEPSSLLLFGSALVALAGMAWLKKLLA
jgi:hypothetical protein